MPDQSCQSPTENSVSFATLQTRESSTYMPRLSIQNLSRQLMGFLLTVLVMVRLNNGDDKSSETEDLETKDNFGRRRKKTVRVDMTGVVAKEEGDADKMPDLEQNDTDETGLHSDDEGFDTEKDKNEEKRTLCLLYVFVAFGGGGFIVVCGSIFRLLVAEHPIF